MTSWAQDLQKTPADSRECIFNLVVGNKADNGGDNAKVSQPSFNFPWANEQDQIQLLHHRHGEISFEVYLHQDTVMAGPKPVTPFH